MTKYRLTHDHALGGFDAKTDGAHLSEQTGFAIIAVTMANGGKRGFNTAMKKLFGMPAPEAMLTAGAHFLDRGAATRRENDLGWMTSVAYSPMVGSSIGLGFVKDGHNRFGDVFRATDFVRGTDIEVEIVHPHFVDPEGKRLHD